MSGDVHLTLLDAPTTSVRVVGQVVEFTGDTIQRLVRDALRERAVTGVAVTVHDNAASEWVVRARIATALRRWDQARRAIAGGAA
jgi:citrate lyase gamma subunit